MCGGKWESVVLKKLRLESFEKKEVGVMFNVVVVLK